MHTLNVSQARNHLTTLLDTLQETHESIVVTKHGKPIAKIESFSEKKTGTTHSLRGLPVRMSSDFNKPMSKLWEALNS